MNRRHAAAMLAGLIASQAAPYKLRAQDAEVTLVEVGDDDAVSHLDEPFAVFTLRPRSISWTIAPEEHRDLLDEADPVRAFTELVRRMKRGEVGG